MSPGKIVLFGLERTLATELERVLSAQSYSVLDAPFHSPEDCLRVADRSGASIAFCTAERAKYRLLLDEIASRNRDLPVVVVSRVPEVCLWLDAIEAGASDYCAPPFEACQIEWILQSSLKLHAAPSARYRAAS